MQIDPEARINSKHQMERFAGRVDVLQVTRAVDCFVGANVLLVQQHRGTAFLHVIVTPDMQGCRALAHLWAHVRCRSDVHILPNVTLESITQLLTAVGPKARSKGAAWFLQQMLKLAAVANGIEGLAEHVRVMDGETLTLRALDWFTRAGSEIFDICGPITGDGYNSERYGALYYRLTRQRLVGSPTLIAHGMSMTRQHVRSLLNALSPPGETWSTSGWVTHSLRHLCDDAAVTGFSEYYYYASWVLRHSSAATPALVRLGQETCKRINPWEWRPPLKAPKCTDYNQTGLANWAATHFGRYAYIVLENHASRSLYKPIPMTTTTIGVGVAGGSATA